MFSTKLCLALDAVFPLPLTDQIRLYKKIGFEGFFTGLEPQSVLGELRRVADDEGMLYQSIHAPFGGMAQLWFPTEKTPEIISEQIRCVRACAENEIPLMIMHAYIGFEKDLLPTQVGIENFGQVVREAEKLGVKIAFENTEGEAFLAALMNAFTTDTVGFCWDSGHQMCYNPATDMMALYGKRLLGTHLNDNLGVRDFGGEITWIDDLHLLPFDGIADWQENARKIKASCFSGPLTFELTTSSKPDRHENDAYARMSLEEYLTAAYMRACRVAALVQRA